MLFRIEKKMGKTTSKKGRPSQLNANKNPTIVKTKTTLPVAVALSQSNWFQQLRTNPTDKKSHLNDAIAKKQDLNIKAYRKQQKIQQKHDENSALIPSDAILAMDCEMVGVGINGKRSVLARCSVVDYHGQVVYDKKVRPVEKVTDFRTHISGIRSKCFKNAISFHQCQLEVGKLFKEKIVVGHSIDNDFKALMLSHPKNMIRDTSRYRPYMRRKINGSKLYPKSLKVLAQEHLNKDIQTGEHDSIEDARAALELYKKEGGYWEKWLAKNRSPPGALVGRPPQMANSSKSVSPS